MRRRLALPDDGGILIAQETAEGILLRPGKVVPADIHKEEEVAEYKRADEELRGGKGLRKRVFAMDLFPSSPFSPGC